MKIIKKLLKWFGILFTTLIVLALLIPYIYKNEIIEFVKKTTNDYLTAKLDFETIDISFLSTFPDLSVEIKDLTLSGQKEFKDVVLTEIKSTIISVNINSILFDDQYKIKSVVIESPSFQIQVNENGLGNYDIVKSDTSVVESLDKTNESALSLALESIEIKNASIIYKDDFYLTHFRLTDLNHSSSIVLDGDSYFMKTITNINSSSLSYNGVDYLKNINTTLDCDLDLLMSEKSMKVNFKKNKAMLSMLNFSFDGWFEMLEEEYNMDLSFSTNNPELKELLSIVPGALTADFNNIACTYNI